MKKRLYYFLPLCFLFSALFLTSGCEKKEYEPAPVVFSVEPGAYPDDISLEISAPDGYTIRYTTDGSLPSRDSRRYTGALTLSGNGNNWLDSRTIDSIRVEHLYELYASPELADAWIIRAAAFAPDGTAGPVSTGTYFPGRSIAADYNGVPVISLVTEPTNLFDYDHGIMVKGHCYDEWLKHDDSRDILNNPDLWYSIEANYTQKGSDWERPVSMELFDGSDRLTLQHDAGLRLQGHSSRMFTHKSLRVYFRKEYGSGRMAYPLFPDDDVTSYKYLTLRNGGNASESLIFKDALQQSLLAGRSFLIQESRPAVVFLNGEYWGVYCLNDRYCEQYLEDHFGIDDAVIVKEDEFEDGNEDAFFLYEELMSYADKDMSDPAVWQEFQEIMDIQCMADYFAAEIYIANADFEADKNIELWRSTAVNPGINYADGRWRYMLYDTEYSSGMYRNQRITKADYDSMSDAIDNHPLFASALHAPEFRQMFLDSLKAIGSVDLAPARVNSTIDQWDKAWQPLFHDHYQRFGNHSSAYEDEIASIKDFYARRYDFIILYAEEILAGYE